MKKIVVYQSVSGHSKKIAQAIAQELKISCFNIRKKPKLEKTDLLFIVGGIYSGKSLGGMLEFVRGISPDIARKVVLVTSSATNKCGQDEVRSILINNGVIVVDEYRCYGSFLFIKFGHPNKEEISKIIDYARNLSIMD